MSRRRQADKRQVLPDAKYGEKVVAKFANILMLVALALRLADHLDGLER